MIVSPLKIWSSNCSIVATILGGAFMIKSTSIFILLSFFASYSPASIYDFEGVASAELCLEPFRNSPTDERPLSEVSSWQNALFPAVALKNWTRGNAGNLKGAVEVLAFMALAKTGWISSDHPWVTGISPDTGRPIWPDNIVFKSPRKTQWKNPEKLMPESDEATVSKVGSFLAA